MLNGGAACIVVGPLSRSRVSFAQQSPEVVDDFGNRTPFHVTVRSGISGVLFFRVGRQDQFLLTAGANWQDGRHTIDLEIR